MGKVESILDVCEMILDKFLLSPISFHVFKHNWNLRAHISGFLVVFLQKCQFLFCDVKSKRRCSIVIKSVEWRQFLKYILDSTEAIYSKILDSKETNKMTLFSASDNNLSKCLMYLQQTLFFCSIKNLFPSKLRIFCS